MADFFNKVMVGINKGVSSVSENSKLFMEKTKLNTSIKDKESEKNKLAQQLGLMAFSMQSRGEISLPQFEELCSKIEKCNSEIEDLNIQLLNLQNVSNSANTENGIECACGYINKSNATFCAGCGAKLEQIVVEEVKGIKCTCGYLNSNSAVFCAGCGARLEQKEGE